MSFLQRRTCTKLIFTPDGLKIRLDAEGVARVLEPVADLIDFQRALREVEIWAHFPNSLAAIAAIFAAVFIPSWWGITLTSIITLWSAHIAQQFFYSRFLQGLIPQLLGRWLIMIPLSLATLFYSYSQERIAAGLVAIFFVVLNLSGMSDFLLFFMMPIMVSIKRALRYDFDDTALALVKILNCKAHKAGIVLDWERY